MPRYTVMVYYTTVHEFYNIDAPDEEAAEEKVKAAIELGQEPDQESTLRQPDDIMAEEDAE